MQETNNKKITIILVAVIVVVVLAIVLYFFKPNVLNIITKPIGIDATRPMVIENEILVIPQTEKVIGTEGRFGSPVTEKSVQTPLVPKSEGEKVVVPMAILTVKGSYALANTDALKWSNDALPSLITSLGAVTLDGKSSQWQVVFFAKSKQKKGYEVVIQGDRIVSQKEVDSSATGGTMTETIKDSGAAIKDSLQSLPQYADASISAVALYYNTDLKNWRYTLTTSRGVISTRAQ